eukprot:PITA_23572
MVISDNGNTTLQINAHIGSVNDIAFVHLQGKLCLITCGDDKTIKVWNAETGCKQYTFEGHEAPVYSLCLHYKVNIQFIISIDVNGKIKAWLYDPPTCKIDYDAPCHGCTAMVYSADGLRLFTCGTNKEGESYLVEREESDGAIKRRYFGIEKQCSEVVKFATTKNRFLAAGDECQIKFWDMDNINILLTNDAEGGLQSSSLLQGRPCLCFNKKGSLLAVTTSDNGIKILANAARAKLVKMLEGRRVTPESKPSFSNIIGAENTTGPVLGAAEKLEKIPSAILLNGVASTSMVDAKQRFQDEGTGENESRNWNFTEIVKLLYTYSGSCLLALDSNATHKLWMWQCNALNPSGKVKANVQPQIWQPPNSTLMKNDTSDRSLEEVVPCLALSKNDSYIMSASGGRVSLFNRVTFKVMENYMIPPPAATCLAFNPFDNNIIAIGMEDSTILIFNIQLRKVIMKLKGHQKRITGLAFSKDLNVLASLGADGQLCVWNINGWEKCKSKGINSQAGRFPSPLAVKTVQFNNINQAQLLVVQESQIAIYDASELECLCHWTPREPMPAHISCATFSCDGLLVYASFFDGSIGVFGSELLRPRCRIAPPAFIPDTGSGHIYPLVIAANPHVPNQIAVGLTDGGVHVIEPST